jgi:hypothetical protein
MPKSSLLCIATSLRQANQIVDCLRDEGFFSDDISAVFPETGGNREVNSQSEVGIPAVVKSASALNWLTDAGARTVAGARNFVVTGHLVSLGTSAPGNTAQNVASLLCRLGLFECDARHLEQKLQTGGVLILVHSEGLEELRRAREIFAQARARNISVIDGHRVGSQRLHVPATYTAAQFH